MFLTHVRNLVTFESDGTFDPFRTFRTFRTFQSAESPESRPGRKPDVKPKEAVRCESHNRNRDLPAAIDPEQVVEIIVYLDLFIANGGLNIKR